ncbi:hypothetical protein JOF56_003018 [Kibdelosporangium banguiense]|uniref:Uncharacterized protein n=1 Tax=Kibdelosporangium banguiense TaxID=1365924 RepID=A0ABS4TDZ3_9PSEU|nr:hypothetical protein [Kibdelosporangium banguiense]MBP2322633.1 hypothetical protein [Kibdelosporangium banguiense]
MSAISSEPAVDLDLTNKDLIANQLWVRLTRRIARDGEVNLMLAERIMDQTLGFLKLCAERPSTESYVPSSLVDIGWHTFILYTKEYAEFCAQITGGRFIHHYPSDEEGVDYGKGNVARTITALKRHGLTVDEPLWTNLGTDCSGDGSCDASSTCGGDSCS